MDEYNEQQWTPLEGTVMYLGVSDYRRGMDIGFIDHLYTPLRTTLYRSLTHTD
jgi:hypothetical protein